MNFLICLVLAGLLVSYGRTWTKNHESLLYGICAALAGLAAIGSIFHFSNYLPYALDRLLWHPIAGGSLATALWVVVMYAGAMPHGSAARKTLMPLRGELSIMAGFLTLGHNLAAGQKHFLQLFTAPGEMLPSHRAAAVCSLVLIAILLPLWITSFPAVRRKMAPRAWKKLQRLAYVFYGLTYVHVLLLYVPMAMGGSRSAFLNVIVYSMVFLGYAGLRIGQALGGKKWPLALAAAAAVLLCLYSRPVPEIPTTEAPAETAASAEGTAPQAPESSGKYLDGVYDGKARGYAGTIKVRVTVEGGLITDILVLTHEEDSPYWERALSVRDDILASQDTDVDAVVSATQSAEGLGKAVENALKQAEK